MAREIEYSRSMTEALFLAVDALRSDANSLRNSLETTTPKPEGSVRDICLSKIEENNQAADLLEGSLKRCGHRDFLKRERDKGNRTYMVP